MSKVNDLRQALAEFTTETERPATAIYLGAKNRRELFMELEIRGCLSYGVGSDPRPKFEWG